jgi:amidophosphoribosyltransferase
MSDALKHECGIALVRLLKPLEFYKKKIWNCFLWHSENVFIT